MAARVINVVVETPTAELNEAGIFTVTGLGRAVARKKEYGYIGNLDDLLNYAFGAAAKI